MGCRWEEELPFGAKAQAWEPSWAPGATGPVPWGTTLSPISPLALTVYEEF